MPLCDILLRLAEEPALYRPLWSEEILREVDGVLAKLNKNQAQRDRRLKFMRESFPEASVIVPNDMPGALTCIPDPNDRHVLAAAIRGHANAIITLNERDFPPDCLKQYDILRQNPDEFLVHQFHMNPDIVMLKVEEQAVAIGQHPKHVTAKLRDLIHATEFANLIDDRL